MEKYEGQLKNFEWNLRKKRSHHSKDKNKIFCDDILTFDIETTSAWINEHGSIIRYKKGKSGEYWNNLSAVSLCYIWQFSVNDRVFYGRELTDFLQLLEDLPKEAVCIIWVHNLSFEFHFLQNIFEGMQIFARQPHKPMKMECDEFPQIEWRCSYMLTRLSLETWGKSLGVLKRTGDLDYRKIRTPLTPLTDKELGYCERDCIVVYNGIKDYLKRYETQFDIPLTQTGTVRREVKKLLLSDHDYHKYIKKLVPRDAKQYKMLQNIFAGGYTHANRLHAGVIQEGIIQHYDFASHYPTMMCAFKYPSSPWAYIGNKMPRESSFEDNAFIMHLRFTRIQCKTFNTYIQEVKAACGRCPRAADCKDCRNCKWSKVLRDNGRIIRAFSLDIWVTEQDYLTIKETYTWDKMQCLGVYKSRKAYLPKAFVEYILELYGNKTTLKDVTDAEQPGAPDLYMQSKQYLNGLFGMSVTALIQSDVVFSNETKEWEIMKLTEDAVNERLKDLKAWTPRERRYFLSYSWGCWVTAYARRMLWKCVLHPGNGLTEQDVLYCDTDSIFILGEADFNWYNNMIVDKLDAAMEFHGLDKDLTRPKDPKKKPRQLGIFDREKDCRRFITLGAKRYLEEREDGKLYLTISGINKGAVYCLDGNMENFRDGFIFDKDHGAVKKSMLTYIYGQQKLIWPDGYKSSDKYGINLRPNGYHLHMTTDYKKLINYVDPAGLPDAFLNHLRGRFTIGS